MSYNFSKLTFDNLHLHSHYSIMDCVSKVEDLIKELDKRGNKHVAITDHGTIGCTYELWKGCNDAGLTPVLGCECYFVDSYDDEGCKIAYNYGHIVVLCMNKIGWDNLKKLQYLAWEKGYNRKPCIQLSDLCKYNEGLIITTGCMRGPIGWDYLGNDKHYGTLSQKARNKRLYTRCRMLKKAFGNRFYAEIQLLEMPEQIKLNKMVIKVADKLGLEVLVTGDCHYLCKEHVRTHDAMICIGRKEKLNDDNNSTYPTNQLWLKDATELNDSRMKWYPYITEKDLVQYIKTTNKIVARVEKYPIRPATSALPVYSKKPEKLVRKICNQHRDAHLLKDEKYKARYEMELEVIGKLKTLDYFLVVWDIAKFARANDIAYHARGSVGGSLVAYLMGISWIDPIKFNCTFERFLTEDRLSLPDIDMDFSSAKRTRIVQYVQEKYGHECVVHICNYNRWQPKQAFKDVGRILGYDFQQLNRLTSKVSDKISKWEDFVEDEGISKFLEDNEDMEPLIVNLLGVIRQQGVHASGVVLTPGPCVQWLPISYRTERDKKGAKLTKVTEWDMYALEALDILKLDFLGLNHLDVVSDAINLITSRHKAPFSNLDELYAHLLADDCSDQETYKMIHREETMGTFQLGTSDGMRALGRDLKPTSIDEIVAMIALYRTAVLEANMHTEYVKRKFGEQYTLPHPKMDKILGATHGVLLYQEQVGYLTVELAGFTATEADHFRKGIKLKDKEKFEVWKKKFISGCSEHSGMDSKTSKKIWGFIEKFAGYGFNLAHAASYGVFAYMTAWLKTHYYLEYTTALLSCNASDEDKLSTYINELVKSKHKMKPPHINLSKDRFTISGSSVMYPFEAIKGVGDKALTDILTVRDEHGRYKSLENFLSRINKRVINVRVISSLILSGCFRKFGTIESVFDEYRTLYASDKNCRQVYCGSCDYRYPVNVKYTEIEENGIVCPNCGAIEVACEKKGRLSKKYRKKKFDKRYLKKHIFGFSSDECQLKQFADVIIKERCSPLSTIDLKEEGETVRIAFEIRKIKQIIDKNSNAMAFLDITDGEYDTSLTIFASDWEDLKPYIKEGGCYAGMAVKNRGKVLFSSRNHCYLKRLVSTCRGS